MVWERASPWSGNCFVTCCEGQLCRLLTSHLFLKIQKCCKVSAEDLNCNNRVCMSIIMLNIAAKARYALDCTKWQKDQTERIVFSFENFVTAQQELLAKKKFSIQNKNNTMHFPSNYFNHTCYWVCWLSSTTQPKIQTSHGQGAQQETSTTIQ